MSIIVRYIPALHPLFIGPLCMNLRDSEFRQIQETEHHTYFGIMELMIRPVRRVSKVTNNLPPTLSEAPSARTPRVDEEHEDLLYFFSSAAGIKGCSIPSFIHGILHHSTVPLPPPQYTLLPLYIRSYLESWI